MVCLLLFVVCCFWCLRFVVVRCCSWLSTVGCWLQVVCRCSRFGVLLFVVCGLLFFVVCCLMIVRCWLLPVKCWLRFVVSCSLVVACCWLLFWFSLFVLICLLRVVRSLCLLFVTC